jgi:hypothetical protein
MNDNIGKFWILGLIVGFGIGSLTGIGVSNYNANVDQAARRQQLIELGVGSYDSRTGAFQVKACPK